MLGMCELPSHSGLFNAVSLGSISQSLCDSEVVLTQLYTCPQPGQGTIWCEKVHQVDYSVDSGNDDLIDDQEEEIPPKKKTKSLAEEKLDRV